MSGPSRLRVLYLTRLATPATDRVICRTIRRHKLRRIMELGIGTCHRALRLIEIASSHSPLSGIHFTGVDLFEARSAADGPGVTLKMAHRLLKATGACVHLVPGDPFTALERESARLGRMELIVVSGQVNGPSMARAWFYIPWLLQTGGQVLWESVLPSGRTDVRVVPREEIDRLAVASVRRRAA